MCQSRIRTGFPGLPAGSNVFPAEMGAELGLNESAGGLASGRQGDALPILRQPFPIVGILGS
jgi:hypothetical protein